MNKDLYYQGWNSTEHIKNFDIWNKYSNKYFNFVYGSFFENLKLIEIINNNQKFSILDFGCASGYLLRFLINRINNFNKRNYLGCDLSKLSIKYAKEIYGDTFFQIIDHNSIIFKEQNKSFDIVYSRDTVMHQLEPYKFIDDLIDISNNFLILRLRTRDVGNTVLDANISCQMHYDRFWMPYIVLNFSELKDHLLRNKFVFSADINKSYRILGGKNNRYLPKDFYYEKTGASETSIIIKIKKDGNFINKLDIRESSILEGKNYLIHQKYKNLIYSFLNKFNL